MEEVTRFTVPISVSCDQCGSKDVNVPEAELPDDLITCNNCGADLGTRATLDERVSQAIGNEITNAMDDMFRTLFEGTPNVRITKR